MRKYYKLVRDKIPEIIEKQEEIPVYQILEEEKYRSELRKKLLEEVNEYLMEYDPKELADLYEVLDALAEIHGGKGSINALQRKKRHLNGGFRDRVFLEYVIDDEKEGV